MSQAATQNQIKRPYDSRLEVKVVRVHGGLELLHVLLQVHLGILDGLRALGLRREVDRWADHARQRTTGRRDGLAVRRAIRLHGRGRRPAAGCPICVVFVVVAVFILRLGVCVGNAIFGVSVMLIAQRRLHIGVSCELSLSVALDSELSILPPTNDETPVCNRTTRLFRCKLSCSSDQAAHAFIISSGIKWTPSRRAMVVAL